MILLYIVYQLPSFILETSFHNFVSSEMYALLLALELTIHKKKKTDNPQTPTVMSLLLPCIMMQVNGNTHVPSVSNEFIGLIDPDIL